MIGGNVKTLRQAAGMSQTDLAERIGQGFRQQTILKIEKGTRPLRLTEAADIANALGVRFEALIDVSPTSEQDKRAKQLARAISTGLFRTAVRSLYAFKGARASIEELLRGELSDEVRQACETALETFTVERVLEVGTSAPISHVEWMIKAGMLYGEEAEQWLAAAREQEISDNG